VKMSKSKEEIPECKTCEHYKKKCNGCRISWCEHPHKKKNIRYHCGFRKYLFEK